MELDQTQVETLTQMIKKGGGEFELAIEIIENTDLSRDQLQHLAESLNLKQFLEISDKNLKLSNLYTIPDMGIDPNYFLEIAYKHFLRRG